MRIMQSIHTNTRGIGGDAVEAGDVDVEQHGDGVSGVVGVAM